MSLADILASSDVLFQRASGSLNALVLALAILFTGIILARILDLILRQILGEIRFDELCTKVLRERRNYARALRNGVLYSLYLLTAYFSLAALGIENVALRGIVLLFTVALVLSAVFFFLEFLPHVSARKKLRRNGIARGVSVVITDEFGSLHGIVMGFGLTHARIERENGEVIFYPLASLTKSRVRMDT